MKKTLIACTLCAGAVLAYSNVEASVDKALHGRVLGLYDRV